MNRIARLLPALAMAMGVIPLSADQAPFYVDKLNVMQVQDEEGHLVPVRSVADWRLRRTHIVANMQLVMGRLPAGRGELAPEVEVLSEQEGPKFTLRKISYVAEPGDRVPAWLFVPTGAKELRPGCVCLHQTTGIGKDEPAGQGGLENLHYARELAQRGLVTIAPDYPGFGEYQIDAYAMGYVSATMKGICNHMRAVDVLQSLPEVDPERIGCIGHSLGGHNTLFLAVFDERVKVAVTSCGFNSFARYMEGDLTGWSHRGYMPRIAELYGTDPTRMPFDFTEVLAAIAPRAVFINAPVGDSNFAVEGVYDCINTAAPVYCLLGASHRLVATHPDCGHDFPLATREQAYEFMARALQSR